ncbi:hypothetical protein NQL31_006404 [Lotmaria passim]
MSALDSATTSTPSSRKEESPVAATSPIPSPARFASNFNGGRLSLVSVNQRSYDSGACKVGQPVFLTPAGNPNTVTTASTSTETSSAASGDDTAAAHQKENVRAAALRTSPASPRTPRAANSATASAAHACIRAADKSEEILNSPPAVPVTATRRLVQSDPAALRAEDPAAAAVAQVDEHLKESPNHLSEAERPLRTPRGALVNTTLVLSPRRPVAAATNVTRKDEVEKSTFEQRGTRLKTSALQAAAPTASGAAAQLANRGCEATGQEGGRTTPDSIARPAATRKAADPAEETLTAALVNAASAASASHSSLLSASEQPKSPHAAPALSARQRTTAVSAARVSSSSLPPSPSLSSGELNGTSQTADGADAVNAKDAKIRDGDEGNVAVAPEEPKRTSPAALATPRGTSMASRVEEIRARLAASRQHSAASAQATTSRSSAESVATLDTANNTHRNEVAAAEKINAFAAAASAEAASMIKELKQTLKDKEKEVSMLTRDKVKAEQLLEKAIRKSDDLQTKWEAEKTAFATFKKETIASKLEARKELHQAQATARAAQAAQEHLQRELEKLKEKLAAANVQASSRVTSASATPVATPRGAPLSVNGSLVAGDAGDAAVRSKLAGLEKEKETLKARVKALTQEAAAATAVAVAAAVAKAEQQNAGAQRAAEAEVEKLRREFADLAETVTQRDAALTSKDADIQKLAAEVEFAKQELAEKERQRQQDMLHKKEEEEKQDALRKHERADASTSTTDDFSQGTTAATSPDPRELTPQPSLPSSSSPPRSPRQVVTFELSVKEATAHLQEELTATQCQVGAYKRMQEHADRRVEQLEAELQSMQSRARDAVEALQKKIREEKDRLAVCTVNSDATALEATKKELEKVRQECAKLKQTVQERGEETAALTSALEEAEDERDVFERQLRDLQQEHRQIEGAARSATEKVRATMAAELKELQGLLDVTRHELSSAEDASHQKDVKLQELQAEVEGLRTRCSELEQQRHADENEGKQKQEALEKAAEASTTKQVDHYKRKVKSLTKKLAEAEKELQVLGEDYTRVCGERDAAVLRYRTEDKVVTEQPRFIECERQHSEQQKANLSFHSDGVTAAGVARDLSDALLSANRAVPSRLHRDDPSTPASARPLHSSSTAPLSITAALAEERQARAQLQQEVSALQTKVAAMERVASSSPIMHSMVADSVDSFPSVENADFLSWPLQQQQQQHRRGTSKAPPRARSPQTTHALDLRFFDPTRSEAFAPAAEAAAEARAATQTHSQAVVPRCSTSQSATVARVSPRRTQALATLSPQKSGCSIARGSTAAADGGMKEAALDATYADAPLPPVYSPAHPEDSSTSSTAGAAAYRGPDLLFSTTAGSLLVSKRGRQVHRPMVVASRSLPCSGTDTNDGTGKEKAKGDNETETDVVACCAALASMSHSIYASRMNAAGLYHLQHRYRFVLRVLTDSDVGEVLVGFADRYVPLESFGAKRNALRYKGCYYVSLQGGRLYAPSQSIRGEPYGGWEAAAATAAARRWQKAREGHRWEVEDDSAGRLAAPADPRFCLSSSSPSQRAASGAAPAELVARVGDEVACVLRLDERSISVEWNGVDCGVAFTGVSLTPSLYPCVEVNGDGCTVELL